MSSTIAELERIRAECRSLVTRPALMSAGVAVVPLPAVDIVAEVGLLTTLLPTISARFGLDHEQVQKLEPHLAQQVLVVASSLGNNVIGRAVTKKLVTRLLQRAGVRIAAASVAKYVPLFGSLIAASVGFGAMKMIGNAHIEDCYRTARSIITS